MIAGTVSAAAHLIVISIVKIQKNSVNNRVYALLKSNRRLNEVIIFIYRFFFVCVGHQMHCTTIIGQFTIVFGH